MGHLGVPNQLASGQLWKICKRRCSLTINAIEAARIDELSYTLGEGVASRIGAGDLREMGTPLASTTNRQNDLQVGVSRSQVGKRVHTSSNAIDFDLRVGIFVTELYMISPELGGSVPRYLTDTVPVAFGLRKLISHTTKGTITCLPGKSVEHVGNIIQAQRGRGLLPIDSPVWIVYGVHKPHREKSSWLV